MKLLLIQPLKNGASLLFRLTVSEIFIFRSFSLFMHFQKQFITSLIYKPYWLLKYVHFLSSAADVLVWWAISGLMLDPKTLQSLKRRWSISGFVQQLGGLKVDLWCGTPASSPFYPNPFYLSQVWLLCFPASPTQSAQGAFLCGMPSWQNMRNGTEHGLLSPWVQLALEQTKSQGLLLPLIQCWV